MSLIFMTSFFLVISAVNLTYELGRIHGGDRGNGRAGVDMALMLLGLSLGCTVAACAIRVIGAARGEFTCIVVLLVCAAAGYFGVMWAGDKLEIVPPPARRR